MERAYYNGVFAPNCKHRNKIVPRRHRSTVDSDKTIAPMSWMQRLKRVFTIDIETGPDCGGNLRVIACIVALLGVRPAQPLEKQ